MGDETAAEAFLVVAARKVDAAEACVKLRARPTAVENIDAAISALQRARAELGGGA